MDTNFIFNINKHEQSQDLRVILQSRSTEPGFVIESWFEKFPSSERRLKVSKAAAFNSGFLL